MPTLMNIIVIAVIILIFAAVLKMLFGGLKHDNDSISKLKKDSVAAAKKEVKTFKNKVIMYYLSIIVLIILFTIVVTTYFIEEIEIGIVIVMISMFYILFIVYNIIKLCYKSKNLYIVDKNRCDIYMKTWTSTGDRNDGHTEYHFISRDNKKTIVISKFYHNVYIFTDSEDTYYIADNELVVIHSKLNYKNK